MPKISSPPRCASAATPRSGAPSRNASPRAAARSSSATSPSAPSSPSSKIGVRPRSDPAQPRFSGEAPAVAGEETPRGAYEPGHVPHALARSLAPVVHDAGTRHVRQLRLAPQPQAQVVVFKVHEEARVEAADALEKLRAREHEAAARERNAADEALADHVAHLVVVERARMSPAQRRRGEAAQEEHPEGRVALAQVLHAAILAVDGGCDEAHLGMLGERAQGFRERGGLEL